MMTKDEQKLKTAGFKIVEAPEWLIDQKIPGGKHNTNIIPGRIAMKITKETEKAYQATITRIPNEELTDGQKVTILKTFMEKNEWIPKSQIKIIED